MNHVTRKDRMTEGVLRVLGQHPGCRLTCDEIFSYMNGEQVARNMTIDQLRGHLMHGMYKTVDREPAKIPGTSRYGKAVMVYSLKVVE
jgi:hypothetical protein